MKVRQMSDINHREIFRFERFASTYAQIEFEYSYQNSNRNSKGPLAIELFALHHRDYKEKKNEIINFLSNDTDDTKGMFKLEIFEIYSKYMSEENNPISSTEVESRITKRAEY